MIYIPTRYYKDISMSEMKSPLNLNHAPCIITDHWGKEDDRPAPGGLTLTNQLARQKELRAERKSMPLFDN